MVSTASFARSHASPRVSASQQSTLSVITRFHDPTRLMLLDEALFSLAIQRWSQLESIVVVQNGSEDVLQAIRDTCDRQPWPEEASVQIVNCAVPAGTDGRSALLNRGIERATGRYLAFLDDDDVVYQHGYALLIEQLRAGDRAIAMGGCRFATINSEHGHPFVTTKDSRFGWGRTRLDLFKANFVPIHSFVIDRERMNGFDLRFDEGLSSHEDYDLLLRVCGSFEPDLAKLSTPVCEYRNHGANGTPFARDGSTLSRGTLQASPHEKGLAVVEQRKTQYTCRVTIDEWVRLQLELDQRRREHGRLLYRGAAAVNEFFDRRPGLASWVEAALAPFRRSGRRRAND